VLAANRQKSIYLKQKMATLRSFPIQHLRQIGMIAAFDVETTQPDFQRVFYQKALSRGVLVRPIDKTVYLMPPYVISEEEIDWLVAQLAELLTEMQLT
jgi:adenosylmethionine---8-amino-7-oxononanoate aminotransferase